MLAKMGLGFTIGVSTIVGPGCAKRFFAKKFLGPVQEGRARGIDDYRTWLRQRFLGPGTPGQGPGTPGKPNYRPGRSLGFENTCTRVVTLAKTCFMRSGLMSPLSTRRI